MHRWYDTHTPARTQVNRMFGLDDMPPEVPPEVAAYRCMLLRAPAGPQHRVHGDAETDFGQSTLPEGLILKRVKVEANDPLANKFVDATVVQRK